MHLNRQSNITFSSSSSEHFIMKLESNRTVTQEVTSTCLRFKSPLNLSTRLQKINWQVVGLYVFQLFSKVKQMRIIIPCCLNGNCANQHDFGERRMLQYSGFTDTFTSRKQHINSYLS